ncbi:hypothetical protein PRZ48_009748 [Zasmidium cellare]|uniref:Uncharacterized protein n=1 Tax=Zasmidium cellare TaxID=395010 RepID=A0ABR0ECJ8_ZASCE|nr:hypothetical protein PRZ48_009748 [Zasmidium cellare]
MAHILHIVPESGAVEQVGYMSPNRTSFSNRVATERFRDRLGSVTLDVGDGEDPSHFLSDVAAHAKKRLDGRGKDVSEEDPAHTLDQALRFAVSETLGERENKPKAVNATQQFPIFVVQIDRSSPGKIT